jgi:hypothetical protein
MDVTLILIKLNSPFFVGRVSNESNGITGKVEMDMRGIIKVLGA